VLKKSILVVAVVVTLVGGIFAVVRATDETASPWQSISNPTIQKSIDLTPNTLPSASNFDCTPATVRRYLATSSYSDCLVTSAVGQVGDNGIIFHGVSESIPVVPPPSFNGLRPVPNQGLFITTSSAPVIGSYVSFYRSIIDKLPLLPQNINGAWQFVLNANPEVSLRSSSGQLLVANTSAMAFSPSGSWMIIDLPGQGMVRINMATFDILPFAPSIQPVNDYSNVTAQLAISNDGQTVVMKPSNASYLRVYNLANCTASMPVATGTMPCPARDYWNDITSQISGFKSIYQTRFINSTQISFTAVYDYASGNFKTATFTMTAPGISPSGIQYLGMGDSYASGEGAFSYVSGTDTLDDHCHLSSKSYAFILSSQIFESGHAVSCSGATMQDIVGNTQVYKGQTNLKLLPIDRPEGVITSARANYIPGYVVQSEFVDQAKPDAITLSIGGNDTGFPDIIANCVSPTSLPKACYPTYEDRQELNQKTNSIFNDLVTTYKSVLKPGKRVYVIGYPQIAALGGSCAVNVHLETSEIEMATDWVNYLNATISRAADKAGVRYVDVSDAFAGHKLCETTADQVAVNGLTAGTDTGAGPLKFIGKESYHPNALGHELLAQTIRLKTNNLTQLMPVGDTSLQAPVIPADQYNLPKTGRAISNLVFDDGLAPDTLVRGQDFTIQSETALKANSAYKISIGGTQIATANTNAQGALTATIQPPVSVDTGFQTVHITGVNQLGQPLDITKTVYVAASSDDYDGDGVTDAADSCRFVPNSGQDVDKDGIDDACDAVIDSPPPLKLTHLQVSVTMTGNSITLTKVP